SRSRDMYGYVEGNRRAAAALYHYTAASRSSPEYVLFPIAFNWRHLLDLALMEIIASGRPLAGEALGYPTGHDILQLMKAARPISAELGDPETPILENVESNLREFDRIDRGGDGFRYPLDLDGDPSLSNATESVSLRALHEAMDAVGTFLSCVGSELSARLDWVTQREAEMEREHYR